MAATSPLAMHMRKGMEFKAGEGPAGTEQAGLFKKQSAILYNKLVYYP